MKFLVDVCTGKALVDLLMQEGHDVRFVRDRDPRMEDEDILAWANSETRIIVTIDKDFGRIIFDETKQHCGVIRLPNTRRDGRVRLLKEIITKHANALQQKPVITASKSKIRIRKSS